MCCDTAAPPEPRPALADFCDAPSPAPIPEGARPWDAVNAFTGERLQWLLSFHCHQAVLKHNELTFLPRYLCTHDPDVDTVMASAFHSGHWWGANMDHRFVLGAGYAGGTPLTNLDAAVMRRAAAQRAASGLAPFGSVAELSEWAHLRPVPPAAKVQAACSRERPLVLDVGANVGYYTIVAAAAGGCSVVALEPMGANAGRLWQSVLANGFADRVTLFKNAVGKTVSTVTMLLNTGNPGASVVTGAGADPKVAAAAAAGGVGGSGAQEAVTTVVLDDLFDGAPHRPRHPFLDRPIAPGDIAILKVDVEGYDAVALWALRGTIEVGRPPLIKVEYTPDAVVGTCKCDPARMMRWLYGLGYAAYSPGIKRALTLEDWEGAILPLSLAHKWDELTARGLQPVRELYLVHESAPVPAVMNAAGPGGVGPV